MKIDNPDLVRFFGKHFVSLGMIDCPLDHRGTLVDRLTHADGSTKALSDGQPAVKRIWSFSGFVISIRDNWFLVTAGHILADIQRMESLGERAIKKTELIDFWGPNVISTEAIPFRLKEVPQSHFRDDKLGVDYGIIYLRPLIRANLERNGVVPVREENWKHQHRVQFESYWMLGLPTEAMNKQIGDSSKGEATSILMELVMIGLEKLDEAPPVYMEHKIPQFYAKLLVDESELKSIDGMSGGPILGFRRREDGHGLYWIVALQSGWLPSSRIVCACPLAPFASGIEAEINEMLDAISQNAVDQIE